MQDRERSVIEHIYKYCIEIEKELKELGMIKLNI